jgi:hypothetical protein
MTGWRFLLCRATPVENKGEAAKFRGIFPTTRFKNLPVDIGGFSLGGTHS